MVQPPLVELGFVSADGATQYDTSNADVRAKVATSGLVCKVLDVTRFAA